MNLTPKLYYTTFQLNPDGKKVLEELCRVYFDRPSYTQGDTHQTAYNEGSKAVINFILGKIATSQQSIGEQDNE